MLIEEAYFYENFNATKHHSNISHRTHHVVNRDAERKRDLRRKKNLLRVVGLMLSSQLYLGTQLQIEINVLPFWVTVLLVSTAPLSQILINM